MSIPVRLPEPSADRPRPAVITAIALVGLAAGLGLARSGTHAPRTAEVAEAPVDESPPPPTEPADAPEPPPAQQALEPAPTGADEAPEPAEIEPLPEEIAPAPQAGPPVEPAAVAPAAPAPAPAPAAAPGARMVVRGRVAYLRCDGVPQRSGPVPCPRDEALEAAAWAGIEALAACPALPSGSGEADVVIDLATGAIPEIRARDTFARDVVRLDAERVVACLTPSLTRVEQHLGASRLLVSFRFAVRDAP